MTTQTSLETVVKNINEALKKYTDKDWNYSRIHLISSVLSKIDSRYVLWYDLVQTDTDLGSSTLSVVSQELSWGSRHSDELGILELVSLRVNKALLMITSDEYWGKKRPILRVMRKDALERHGIDSGIWYVVKEVEGEEFDSR